MNKKLLRKDILVKRASLGKIDRKNYTEAIWETILNTPFYKNAKTIMCFVSFGSEIDTHEFIKTAIEDGKRLVVPITVPETKELRLSHLHDLSELEVGFFNILTPKEEFIRDVDPSQVDMIIVPGAVFDREGYRIGFGGGYYDRFLSKIDKSVPKIAIAFDFQILDKVPREDYDIPVDYIVTEKEFIKCNPNIL